VISVFSVTAFLPTMNTVVDTVAMSDWSSWAVLG
jgi:hypothetical protein